MTTRQKNTPKRDMETDGKPMSTSFLSTLDDRITIKIPKSSKICQYLDVDTKADARAKWEKLDSLLSVARINAESNGNRIFDDFVLRMGEIYPGKIPRLRNLRALILWHILHGEELPATYWQKLKEA